MPKEVAAGASVALPPPPTPDQEQPVDATPRAARYIVRHSMIRPEDPEGRAAPLSQGAIVEADDLGSVAARARLLELGAIAPYTA